ncbi:MAG: hypothetical protein AAF432_12920 [Planctomycetota bacterium]
MPVILNWFLRLIITNPIVMRIVQGGSRRARHLYIRAGYLALMIVVLLFVLLNATSGGELSMRELAASGATMFRDVSYLQVILIILLTPVFMAGAIAQEANPRTWDIMLTTPLSALQIVLGNLFGRLFFILALLFSSLPLFTVTQYFGGVPGETVFASYAIAACSSLIVAAIAVTLSVTRTAGRRAVVIFFISVVMYVAVTYFFDLQFRTQVAAGSSANWTTVMTPVNPLLALEVLMRSNVYVPNEFVGQDVSWLRRLWFGRPIAVFCWGCMLISIGLMMFSTLRLRVIGAKTGSIPWYRKLAGLGAKGATERTPRKVGANPIVWREAHSRGKTVAAIFGRWSFFAGGVILAIVLLALYHTGTMGFQTFREALATVLAAEVVIIALVALNLSATAVSREREDGSLDIILTTPIQPGPYLWGKLRGLVQFLLPMLLVPIITTILVAAYVLFGGLGVSSGVTQTMSTRTGDTINVALMMPELAIALGAVLPAFIAACVIVGLDWSIRSKGTISSIVGAAGVVIVVSGIISLCLFPISSELGAVSPFAVTFSPINLLFAAVFPENFLGDAAGATATGPTLIIGAIIAAIVFGSFVYGYHGQMKRGFMMTVRKLAGTH